MGHQNNDKGWFLLDHYDLLDNARAILVEVTPENDIAEHITSEDCECIPRMDVNIEGIPVMIHNSFDGREVDESHERGN